MSCIKDHIVMALYAGPKGLDGLFVQVSSIMGLKNMLLSRQTFWANLSELVQYEKVGVIEQSEYRFQYYLTAKQRMEPIVKKMWHYISELDGWVQNHPMLDPSYRKKSVGLLSEWRKNLEFRALYVRTESDLINKIIEKIRGLEEYLARPHSNEIMIQNDDKKKY